MDELKTQNDQQNNFEQALRKYFVTKNFENIKTLLESNIGNVDLDFTFTDGMLKGTTPLHLACNFNLKEIVELLIKEGVNINQAITNGLLGGLTPLYLACKESFEEIAKSLIDKGADINQPIYEGGYAGSTPLHIACKNKHIGILKILLSQPNMYKSFVITDSKGKTPEDLIVGNAEIEQLFEDYRIERIKSFKSAEDDFGSFALSIDEVTDCQDVKHAGDSEDS